MNALAYIVRRESSSLFVDARHLRHHILQWGDPTAVTPEQPTLVLLHGWMDVAASFQFVVDALHADRHVLALDWRGFGLSGWPAVDSYWIPDYLGDLEAVLDALLPAQQPIDLLGHSMGGNVVMLYAGVRPQRVRRVVNLEGFGMPVTRPDQAPRRYAQWLDALKEPARLRHYPSVEAVAERLVQNNPLLSADKAAWLAPHWSRLTIDGTWEILGDPAHKRISPLLYQRDEALACWKLIAAPVLWIEGDRSDPAKWWGTRYSKAEFHQRLDVVPTVTRETLAPAGHMLHHDQPEALARRLEAFLS
ncbi:MAG: alpha/beta hydrolase [Burkholderiaceae bacterium]